MLNRKKVRIEKDDKLHCNTFKCAACCMGTKGLGINCQEFEKEHGFSDCKKGKHHYIWESGKR